MHLPDLPRHARALPAGHTYFVHRRCGTSTNNPPLTLASYESSGGLKVLGFRVISFWDICLENSPVGDTGRENKG